MIVGRLSVNVNVVMRALFLLIAIGIPASLTAQIDAGSIAGTVTDSSGAVRCGSEGHSSQRRD